LGAFSPAAGAPAAGENRAFRGYAVAPATPPLRGAVSASHPYNRLRSLKASFAVKVGACFHFEIGITTAFLRTTLLIKLIERSIRIVQKLQFLQAKHDGNSKPISSAYQVSLGRHTAHLRSFPNNIHT
jgi:hypothetical protein